jgi:hypothetical protein
MENDYMLSAALFGLSLDKGILAKLNYESRIYRLGAMGSSMDLNTMVEGNQLVVYNQRKDSADPHLTKGAPRANMPHEVAAASVTPVRQSSCRRNAHALKSACPRK